MDSRIMSVTNWQKSVSWETNLPYLPLEQWTVPKIKCIKMKVFLKNINTYNIKILKMHTNTQCYFQVQLHAKLHLFIQLPPFFANILALKCIGRNEKQIDGEFFLTVFVARVNH